VADAFAKPNLLHISRGEGAGEWIDLSDAAPDNICVLKPEGGAAWIPRPQNGERFILSCSIDGTRQLFSVPRNGNDILDANSKTWPNNYNEVRMNKQERTRGLESIIKHSGNDISVPMPANAADWLYIMRPEGGGDWIPAPSGSGASIGMPDGTFIPDAANMPAATSIAAWISKPGGGGSWLPIPVTASSGTWNAGLKLLPWTPTNRFSTLANALSTANAGALEPGCALCGQNPAIVFGSLDVRWNSQQSQYSVRGTGASSIEEDPWHTMPASNGPNTTGSVRAIEAWNGQLAKYPDEWGENSARGTWKGLYFGNSSSSGSILRGVVVAYREGGDPNHTRMPMAGAGSEAGQQAAPFIPGGSVISAAVSGPGAEAGRRFAGASAAIHVEDNSEGMRRFLIADSLITQNLGTGIELRGGISFNEKSTGNYIIVNREPLRVDANALGSVPSGNYFKASVPKALSPLFNFAANRLGSSISSKLATNEDLTNRLVTPEDLKNISATPEDLTNKSNWISVTSSNNEGRVTHSATWKNLSIPYHFETGIVIGGSEAPVVTVEAGTRLIFEEGTGVKVGIVRGAGVTDKGSLRIMGKGDSPVLFTSSIARAGGWKESPLLKQQGKKTMWEAQL
jgi:hypothetical protein